MARRPDGADEIAVDVWRRKVLRKIKSGVSRQSRKRILLLPLIPLLLLFFQSEPSASADMAVAGYYQGTTSQGKPVSFSVTPDGKVSGLCLTLAYSCNSCNGSKQMCFPDQQFPIINSCFRHANVSGNQFEVGGCIEPGDRISGFIYYISDGGCGTCNDYVTWTTCCTDCAPLLTVLSPNGGERWPGGEKQTVSWGASGGVDLVTISYSTDEGASWQPIVDSLSGPNCLNSYEWLVPQTPSTSCLVKIQALGDSAVCDTSDLTFTICEEPALTLVSPNGGEAWKLGDTLTISWTWEGCIDLVKLEYSVDGGESWKRIIDSTPNTGFYAWKVSGASSFEAYVRVSDVSHPSVSDHNDLPFRLCLPSLISVVVPNGGETWSAGSQQEIGWTSTGCIDSLALSYSEDGGVSWVVIDSFAAGTASYLWMVPQTTTSSCLVRVSEVADTTVSDVSDDFFSICAEPRLAVVAPNGGEFLLNDSTFLIQWRSEGCIAAVDLAYSMNQGATWIPIVSQVANTASFPWAVPDTESGQCLVQVRDAEDTTVFDHSDSVFSICEPPGVTLLRPNGGEVVLADSLCVVRWQTMGCMDEVSLAYSLDGGLTWVFMATAAAAAREYEWAVPDTSSAACLMSIWDVSDPGVTDVSDSAFSICSVPRLKVISPNGGETILVGSRYDIQWQSEGCMPQVSISFSGDGGQSWSTITAGTANDGLFAWNVPLDTSSTCLVSVRSLADPAVADTCDAFFFIEEFPSIQVLAPDGGEEWWVGSTEQVTWIWSGSIHHVDISFSHDGGQSWTVIAGGADNNGALAWLVPALPSIACLLRIADSVNGAMADTSDGFFSIAEPLSLVLLAPNGGEMWEGAGHEDVLWSWTGVIDSIAIALSLDGGVYWGDPVVVPNTGSCSWATPDTFSDQCLLRIHDVLHPGIADVSDEVFSLTIPKQLMLLVPQGGETWFVDSTYTIEWSSAGPVTAVNLEYSHTGGLSWTVIEANTPNDGRYDWKVPAAPSLTCLVRISDSDSAELTDESAGFFTIRQYPTLTLIAPQGGEQWRVGEVQNILWSSTGLISSVAIAYSERPGSSWVTIAGSTLNDGIFPWPIPNWPSPSCLVRIWDVFSPQVADTSRVSFAILPLQVPLSVVSSSGRQATTGNTVPIEVNNRMSLGRLQFALDYTAGDITAVSVTGTERIADMSRFTWDQAVAGRVHVSIDEGRIPAGHGPVALIHFTIAPDAVLGQHPLRLMQCAIGDSLSRDTFECLTQDGALTVFPRQTFSLQGHIRDEHGQGLPGITITMVDDTSQSVVSGSDGYYQLGGLVEGNYTIIPSQACWTFQPPLRHYVSLDSSHTGQDFIGYTLGRSSLGWVAEQGDVTLTEGAQKDTLAVWFRPGLPCSLHAVETAWSSSGTVMMYVWEAGADLLAEGAAPARGAFAGYPLGEVIAGPIPFTVEGSGDWERFEFGQVGSVPVIGGPDDPGRAFFVGWVKVVPGNYPGNTPHILAGDVFATVSHSWFGGPWTGPDGPDPQPYRWGGYDADTGQAPNLEYAVRLDLSFPWCPSDVSVGLPDASGVEGDTLSLPLCVYSVVTGLDIRSYSCLLSFDETLLEVVDCLAQFGDLGADWPGPQCDDRTAGRLSLSQSGSTPLVGSGILMHIRFRLLSGWKECSPLLFLSFSFGSQGPPVHAADGRVCVEAGSQRCHVSGYVEHYSNHQPLAGAQLVFSSNHSDTAGSDEDGLYRFDRLLCSLNDTICAAHPDYPDNGVTAYDAALVVQGVAAMIELTPWQQIAGDVSSNCAVTAYDAALIAQRAARLVPSFPAGPWVVIPEKIDLTSQTWCTATRCLTHTPLAMDRDGQDFRAVPVGDVSGNWSPGGLPRVAGLLHLLPEMTVKGGQTFSVPVSGQGLGDLVALDLDLSFDPEVIHLDSISAGGKNGHMALVQNCGPGLLRLAMFGATPALSADLVRLHFTAKGPTGSSPLCVERFLANELPFTVAEGRVTVDKPMPDSYGLEQNYPNPFNAATTISYTLPMQSTKSKVEGEGTLNGVPSTLCVTLKIFNVMGQQVATLVDEVMEPGYHTAVWNGRDVAGRDLPSGIYFCRMQAGSQALARKMLLLR